MHKLLTIIAALALSIFCAGARNYELKSPDGRLCVTLQDGASSDAALTYSLSYNGEALVDASPVSMTLSDGTVWAAGKCKGFSKSSGNAVLESPLYRKASVSDVYNAVTVRYRDCNVEFRAYDEGVAWRFVQTSKRSSYNVNAEQATFKFSADRYMYVGYTHKRIETLDTQFADDFENTYKHLPVSQWNPRRMAFLPTMFEGPKGTKMVITESDLVDYPGMFLYNGDASTTVCGRFAPYPLDTEIGGHNGIQVLPKTRDNYIARCDGAPRSFPWRIICFSEQDSEMADNDMVWRLARPCPKDEDFSWVKPGKVAWDWWNNWSLRGVDFKAGINNETYKYYIDFASKYGIEYVILDEGWAVKYANDLLKVVPEIDVRELVEYGREKGVGIILWAGFFPFAKDLEKVCSYYSAMGVKGFKVDFLERDDQPMEQFMYLAAETCAKYKLVLDFHGTHKPTGLQRRFPNILNYEGIFGLEQLRKRGVKECDMPAYDVTLPFIRFVAGFADYTQGAMKNGTKVTFHPNKAEPMSQGTRCHQLAEYVVFDSPLNMLCDTPSNYIAEPAVTSFIAAFPTVWDETRVLDGKVGEYIATARRKGDDWYIGVLTDWTSRDIKLDLRKLGLPEGAQFHFDAFVDGANADKSATDFVHVEFDAKAAVQVHLAKGGGFAAKVTLKK